MRIAGKVFCAMVILGGLLASGCGSAPSNGDTKPLSADDQIKQIEDNPHMPLEAKTAAIARFRQGQAQGQGQGKASPKAGG